MFFFRNKPSADASPFWFVGLHISSRARKLEAALIGVANSRPGAEVTLPKSVSFDLPDELSQLYAGLREEAFYDEATIFRNASRGSESATNGVKRSRGQGRTDEISAFARFLELRAMVALIEEEAVEELLRDTKVAVGDLVLVAVNEPTLAARAPERSTRSTRASIGSAAALAERLGVPVLDSLRLNAGDELPGGDPNLLLAYWTLLSSGERDKLLVDFGERARWRYIPSAANDPTSWKRARFEEVAPCGALLDPLALEVSKGETPIDVGGKLSVQGQRIAELLDFWRAQSALVAPSAVNRRLSATGSALNERFYLETLQRFGQKISSLDALCTAANLIAESTVDSIKARETEFASSYDLIVAGAAKRNGLIMSRVGALMSPKAPHRLEEYGLLEDSFDGVAVALMGAFYASGVCAAVPEYFGGEKPALLGRLNCGGDVWKNLSTFRNRSTKS